MLLEITVLLLLFVCLILFLKKYLQIIPSSKYKLHRFFKSFFYPHGFKVELKSLFLPSDLDEQLEDLRLLEVHQNDNLSFFGVDGRGFRLCLKITRSVYNTSEGLVFLKNPDNSVYCKLNKTSKFPGMWCSQSLLFERNEPMKSWRLSFNGNIRSGSGDEEHVKINLIWKALCKPNLFLNRNGVDLDDALEESSNRVDGYTQCGILIGTIRIGNHVKKLHLMSSRLRFWGREQCSTIIGFTNFGIIYDFKIDKEKIFEEDEENTISSSSLSTAAKLSRIFMPRMYRIFSIFRRKNVGSLRFPNGKMCIVSEYFACQYSPSRWELNILGRDLNQPLSLKPDLKNTVISTNQKIQSFNGFFNSDSTEGFIIYAEKNLDDDSAMEISLDHSQLYNDELLLSLYSPLCRDHEIVGGKAASLSTLTELEKNSLGLASVPQGFCLTKAAMELQLESSKNLKIAMSALNEDFPSYQLREITNQVQNAWRHTRVCEELRSVIERHIQPGASYAVRSSGLSEDLSSASSAGQNSSFLCRTEFESVLEAVQMCWASLYSYHSVHYRRMHGLPIISNMGVIIQKMVPAEIAGVLFTCNPVTGDHSTMILSANFGLGETVVSGAVEPDTVEIQRNNGDTVSVISEECGNKTHQLSVSADGSLMKLNLNKSTALKMCISKSDAESIAKVGMRLEEIFECPCDLEWAIHEDTIYVLQCRPITTLHSWTDEELLHEFDSAILPNEISSTANTGEVLPNATSILAQSLIVKILDVAVTMQKSDSIEDFYNTNAIIMSQHHALLNVFNTILNQVEKERGMHQLTCELAVCGQLFSNDDIQYQATMRNGISCGIRKAKAIIKALQSIFWAEFCTEKSKECANNFSIPYESFESSVQLFELINQNLHHLTEVAMHHSLVSSVNVFWQVIILTILLEGEKDLSCEHFEDVCQILRSCSSVITTGIPNSLELIAAEISACDESKEFVGLATNMTKKWLKENCPKAWDLLTDFLVKYSHRSVKEMDLFTRTWGLDSSPIIANLQNLVRGKRLNGNLTNQKPSEEVISTLKTPRKSSTRRSLKYVIPHCSRTSGWRESTKDSLLLVIHKFRKSFNHLAHLMAKENYIPQRSMLFFCSYHEIKEILKSRNATIIQKALRRQRLYHEWEKENFPNIMIGLPESIESSTHSEEDQFESVRGTLVFPGKVDGRACVVIDPQDANNVLPGDILIMRSTDVGWSPLFPLAKGLVTELGGLISHGAVVAREYGLPCLVGATSATSLFKTGDSVILDGQKGILYKTMINESSHQEK